MSMTLADLLVKVSGDNAGGLQALAGIDQAEAVTRQNTEQLGQSFDALLARAEASFQAIQQQASQAAASMAAVSTPQAASSGGGNDQLATQLQTTQAAATQLQTTLVAIGSDSQLGQIGQQATTASTGLRDMATAGAQVQTTFASLSSNDIEQRLRLLVQTADQLTATFAQVQQSGAGAAAGLDATAQSATTAASALDRSKQKHDEHAQSSHLAGLASQEFGGKLSELGGPLGTLPQLFEHYKGGLDAAGEGENAVALGAASAGVALGALAVGAVAEATKSFVEYADSVREASEMSGASEETVQGLGYLLETVGQSADSATRPLEIMARNTGTMKQQLDAGTPATGAFAKALADLNINAAAFAQSNPDEQLRQLFDAFKEGEGHINTTTDAMAIWGRQGATMIPIATQGSAALQQGIATVDKYGASVEKSQADVLAFHKEMADLQTIAQGLEVTIGGPVIRAVTEFDKDIISATGHMRDFVDEIGKIPGADQAASFFEFLGKAAIEGIPGVNGVLAVLDQVNAKAEHPAEKGADWDPWIRSAKAATTAAESDLEEFQKHAAGFVPDLPVSDPSQQKNALAEQWKAATANGGDLQKEIQALDASIRSGSEDAATLGSHFDTVFGTAVKAGNLSVALETVDRALQTGNFTALQAAQAYNTLFTEDVKAGRLSDAIAILNRETQNGVTPVETLAQQYQSLFSTEASSGQLAAAEATIAQGLKDGSLSAQQYAQDLNTLFSTAGNGGTEQELLTIEGHLHDAAGNATDLKNALEGIFNKPSQEELQFRAQIAQNTSAIQGWNATLANSSPIDQRIASLVKLRDEQTKNGASDQQRAQTEADLARQLGAVPQAEGDAIVAGQHHADVLADQSSAADASMKALAAQRDVMTTQTAAARDGAAPIDELNRLFRDSATAVGTAASSVDTNGTAMVGKFASIATAGQTAANDIIAAFQRVANMQLSLPGMTGGVIGGPATGGIPGIIPSVAGGSGSAPTTASSSNASAAGGVSNNQWPWLADATSWASAHGIDPMLMAALIFGESSGRTDNPNTSDPYGGSFGLLQINGVHRGEVDFNRVNDLPYILGQTFEGPTLASAYSAVQGRGLNPATDPKSFLSQWWPLGQGSVQPTNAQLDLALAQAQAALSGGTPTAAATSAPSSNLAAVAPSAATQRGAAPTAGRPPDTTLQPGGSTADQVRYYARQDLLGFATELLGHSVPISEQDVTDYLNQNEDPAAAKTIVTRNNTGGATAAAASQPQAASPAATSAGAAGTPPATPGLGTPGQTPLPSVDLNAEEKAAAGLATATDAATEAQRQLNLVQSDGNKDYQRTSADQVQTLRTTTNQRKAAAIDALQADIDAQRQLADDFRNGRLDMVTQDQALATAAAKDAATAETAWKDSATQSDAAWKAFLADAVQDSANAAAAFKGQATVTADINSIFGVDPSKAPNSASDSGLFTAQAEQVRARNAAIPALAAFATATQDVTDARQRLTTAQREGSAADVTAAQAALDLANASLTVASNQLSIAQGNVATATAQVNAQRAGIAAQTAETRREDPNKAIDAAERGINNDTSGIKPVPTQLSPQQQQAEQEAAIHAAATGQPISASASQQRSAVIAANDAVRNTQAQADAQLEVWRNYGNQLVTARMGWIADEQAAEANLATDLKQYQDDVANHADTAKLQADLNQMAGDQALVDSAEEALTKIKDLYDNTFTPGVQKTLDKVQDLRKAQDALAAGASAAASAGGGGGTGSLLTGGSGGPAGVNNGFTNGQLNETNAAFMANGMFYDINGTFSGLAFAQVAKIMREQQSLFPSSINVNVLMNGQSLGGAMSLAYGRAQALNVQTLAPVGSW